MDERTLHCPNCSAPLTIPLGETEHICEFCESQLRFIPKDNELEVVKTREEMKYKERVANRKIAMEKQLKQEEAEKWRRTTTKIAIAAMPYVGNSVGRALFRSVLRGRGCGCGCLLPVLSAFAALLSLLAFL